MPTDYLTNDTDLTSVADAIRIKAEISGSLIFPSGFISAIQNIQTGGNLQSKSVTIAPSITSQSQSVTPDSGYDGLSQLDIFTNAAPTQSKTITITPSISSQSQTLTPDSGYYGMSQVVITVDSATLQTKSLSITPSISSQTQTITTDSGYYGMSQVTVSVSAVPTYSGAHHTAASNYTVTVSLTNPVNAMYFDGGYIYTLTGYGPTGYPSTGEKIATIYGAVDTAVVNISSSVLGIVIQLDTFGGDFAFGTITCTGGVSNSFKNDGDRIVAFEITGNGTIVLDGNNYND